MTKGQPGAGNLQNRGTVGQWLPLDQRVHRPEPAISVAGKSPGAQGMSAGLRVLA